MDDQTADETDYDSIDDCIEQKNELKNRRVAEAMQQIQSRSAPSALGQMMVEKALQARSNELPLKGFSLDIYLHQFALWRVLETASPRVSEENNQLLLWDLPVVLPSCTSQKSYAKMVRTLSYTLDYLQKRRSRSRQMILFEEALTMVVAHPEEILASDKTLPILMYMADVHIDPKDRSKSLDAFNSVSQQYFDVLQILSDAETIQTFDFFLYLTLNKASPKLIRDLPKNRKALNAILNESEKVASAISTLPSEIRAGLVYPLMTYQVRNVGWRTDSYFQNLLPSIINNTKIGTLHPKTYYGLFFDFVSTSYNLLNNHHDQEEEISLDEVLDKAIARISSLSDLFEKWDQQNTVKLIDTFLEAEPFSFIRITDLQNASGHNDFQLKDGCEDIVRLLQDYTPRRFANNLSYFYMHYEGREDGCGRQLLDKINHLTLDPLSLIFLYTTIRKWNPSKETTDVIRKIDFAETLLEKGIPYQDRLPLILQSSSDHFFNGAVMDNFIALLRNGATVEESLDLSRIVVPDYTVLAHLGSGSIKKAYLAKNKTTGDELVLLQVDPDSKGFDHYRQLYNDLPEAQIREKILGNEFSATKILTVMEDTRYLAITLFPLVGQIFDEHNAQTETYFIPIKRFDHTLEDELQKGRLDENIAMKYLYQICYGLSNCHEVDIIHKDLKPDNIGITSKGNVLITDFGCVSMFSTGSDARYQCPLDLRPPELAHSEEYWKEQGVTWQSDLFTPKANAWSVGAIFYRMLTGDYLVPRPAPRASSGSEEFHAQNIEIYEIIQHFRHWGPEMIDEIKEHNKDAAHLLEKLLQPDPEQRKGALQYCRDYIKSRFVVE